MGGSPPIRVVLLWVLITPCALVGGCTQEMWEHVVGDYSSEYKQLSGSVSHEEGARVASLAVVDYDIVFPSAKTYRFVVPLDSEGYAPYPFGYRGRERTPIRIYRDIPRRQREAVHRARLQPASSNFGATFRALVESSIATTDPTTGPSHEELAHDYTREKLAYWRASHFVEIAESDDVTMTAYRLRPDGSVELLRVPNVASDTFAMPEGFRVLLLPERQPRPPSETAGPTIVAVLLTPLMLTVDVVKLPFALVLVPLGAGV